MEPVGSVGANRQRGADGGALVYMVAAAMAGVGMAVVGPRAMVPWVGVRATASHLQK